MSEELMSEDIAAVEAVPEEVPTAEETLREEVASLLDRVADLSADVERFAAEVVVREQERDAAIAESVALLAKVEALKADLSRDGAVFGLDFHFKTEGAMYARETIEQRVRAAVQRAGI